MCRGIYPIEFKNQHELLPWAEPAMSIEGRIMGK